MLKLNPSLLLTSEFADELLSSPLKGTSSRGVYNPMQFVLRLREDVHRELNSAPSGISPSGGLSNNQIQAFSTYLHETIHWWQHVGSNFGFISSLKYPAQAHVVHRDLNILLKEKGAFKSIAKYDRLQPGNENVNKVLNYWHDIEFAGQIAFDHNRIKKIYNNPYFECWGHSYDIMWSSAIWTLASTLDKDLTFLPNIKNWEPGFEKLRQKKIEGFFYGSGITIPPIGIRAIFEGQARFSQLQYLFRANESKGTMNDFEKAGMLRGIYIEAFNHFLAVIGVPMPQKADDPLIGLFLLICDVSINPTDGFPFDITHFESFLILNDPGYRFSILCKMVRDKHPNLLSAIREYTKEEYILHSKTLADSISCFSPYDSTQYILKWIDDQPQIKELLEQESIYKFPSENLPIRLFFSKFLRFQEDKNEFPHVFCWPGMNFTEPKKSAPTLLEVQSLFEKHKALFIDDVDGNIYHSLIEHYSVQQVDETLNEFFSWNVTYDMIRKWIIEEGNFSFNYNWLTSKFSDMEMRDWVSNNFEVTFGVKPENFKIL